MNKIIFFTLLLFCTNSALAQSAEEAIGNAINTSDFFLLDEEYSRLKNEIQIPMLKYFSESLLNAIFNRPEAAVISIDSLVSLHQEEIGFENVMSMLDWQNDILFRMGEYCEASSRAESFLKQASSYLEKETVNALTAKYKYYKSMCGQSKTELIRPEKDCVITYSLKPIEIENARKGYLPYVPVLINGNKELFIFDNGCPGGLFLSEEYARKLGTTITFDSLQVSGVGGSGWGKMGILDSITLGNMTLKNLVVTIVPPTPAVDSIYKIDKVLGSDIMKYAGEVQIYPKEKKIVFPFCKTPLPETGKNMMLSRSDGFLIKSFSGEERLIMLLDTGDSSSELFSSYYNKNKNIVNINNRKESLISGGFGGTSTKDYYRIPTFPLRIGSKNFEMKDLYINIDTTDKYPYSNEYEGSLGMAFINLFDKVTISFNEMFIELD